jgi:hypothetical protein
MLLRKGGLLGWETCKACYGGGPGCSGKGVLVHLAADLLCGKAADLVGSKMWIALLDTMHEGEYGIVETGGG